MSGAPKVRSMNVADTEVRPVLGPAGNKARSLVTRKPALKPLRKAEVVATEEKKDPPPVASSPPTPTPTPTPPPSPSVPSILRRQEKLCHSNSSLNASCSSDASSDSLRSRASTGRITRTNSLGRRKKYVLKMEKVVPNSISVPTVGGLQGKKRCAWVTPNTDQAYAAFHDEEWGVPVHDDKKLFELLVLSGALAELTWPAILGKRHIFREVFADFDPILVSKLNEKKIIAPGTTASSLLSEPKLRAIIENARQMPKIIEEFGSFDKYCWSFMNQKPIVSRFRYPRQVPVKTPKADVISKDLVRRGFRSVGPTIVYNFMQAAGITNDHLIGCYRFGDCVALAAGDEDNGNKAKVEDKNGTEGMEDLGLLANAVDDLNLSQ